MSVLAHLCPFIEKSDALLKIQIYLQDIYMHRVPENAPTLASYTSFNKHELNLIILGKQH